MWLVMAEVYRIQHYNFLMSERKTAKRMEFDTVLKRMLEANRSLKQR